MNPDHNLPPQIAQILNDTTSWLDARPADCIDKFGIAGGDGIETWLLKLLRFGNQMAALCYAYGISWESLQHGFPEVFSVKYHYDNLRGPSWPSYEDFRAKNLSHVKEEILQEIFDQNRWEWYKIEEVENNYYQGQYNQYFKSFSIKDQISFVEKFHQRIPKKVLDIGGGRGELANVFKKLDVPCVSIDPGQHADLLYRYTGELFFGKTFSSAHAVPIDLHNLTAKIELNEFDTIIFCESIEHVSESEFWNFWQELKYKFQGYVIIVNWIYYHPIEIDFPQHIFRIDDDVYDRMIHNSRRCIFRNNSHLVLEV